MRLLLIFLALCSGSIVTVLTTRRKAEEAVPFTITAIIVLLFLFYINDRLSTGYYFLLVVIGLVYLCSVSFVVVLWRKKRDVSKVKDVLQRVFTPGMAVFFILFFFLYIITRFSLVSEWDSLRLWAGYPKAMYYTNRLQLGVQSLIYTDMQPYPPGMALFQYFLQRLSGSFKETNLFWEYGIVAISVFMPAIRRLNWKNIWRVFVSAFLVFITPMFFSNSGFNDLNMYRSLYIDPVLGLLFAYCVFIGFQDEAKDLFTTIRIGVGMGTLTLMKDSGLTLAIIAFLIILVTDWTKRRDMERKEVVRRLSLWIISLASVAVCYCLWRITLNQYGVSSFYHFNLQNFPFDLSFAKEFIKALFSKSVLHTSMFGASFGPVVFSAAFAETVCFIFALLLAKLRPKEGKNRFFRLFIGLAAGNLLFFFGLYFTYQGVFDKTIVCFERYTCTILQANIALLISLLLDTDIERLTSELSGKKLGNLAITVIAICCIVLFPLNIEPRTLDAAPESKIHANIISSAIDKSEGKNPNQKTSVYIAFLKDEFDIRHHRIYFELLSDNIFVEQYCLNAPGQSNYVFCINPTMDNIAQMKLNFLHVLTDSQCAYVYFADSIPQAATQMPELFSEGAMKGNMYKVMYSEAGEIIAFQKVATQTEGLAPYMDN